jgi:hypothetical protein
VNVLRLRGDFGYGNRRMCRREVLGKPALSLTQLHPFSVHPQRRCGDG